MYIQAISRGKFSLATLVSGSRFLSYHYNLLNLRVGYVARVDLHAQSDKLYVSQIELDPNGTKKQVCSGLREHLPIVSLQDQLVIVVNNMKKCKLRGELSEAMILCGESAQGIELCRPQQFDKNLIGATIMLAESADRAPTTRILKRKEWDEISSRLYVGDGGIVVYKDENGNERQLCVEGTHIPIVAGNLPRGTPIR